LQNTSTFEAPMQRIRLDRLPQGEPILDVGAGGEGLVSRIEGARVCAIDIRMDEIREARIHDPPSNWFVGDGRALCFRDSSFQVATLWFSLGYMRDWETKHQVMKEVQRVLKPDGVVSIMASKIVCKEDRFLFRVVYTLPDGTISQTGYGVRGKQDQTLESASRLLEDMGFRLERTQEHEHWFEILAVKQ